MIHAFSQLNQHQHKQMIHLQIEQQHNHHLAEEVEAVCSVILWVEVTQVKQLLKLQVDLAVHHKKNLKVHSKHLEVKVNH
jgi:hypothetical protein